MRACQCQHPDDCNKVGIADAVVWDKRSTSMTKVRVGRAERDASLLLWSVQLLMSAPVCRQTSRTDAPFGPAR